METVAPQALARWAVACLEKAGVPPPEARLVGDSLVQTSVWGVDSHGVLRIPYYIQAIHSGKVKSNARPHVLKQTAVSALVER